MVVGVAWLAFGRFSGLGGFHAVVRGGRPLDETLLDQRSDGAARVTFADFDTGARLTDRHSDENMRSLAAQRGERACEFALADNDPDRAICFVSRLEDGIGVHRQRWSFSLL